MCSATTGPRPVTAKAPATGTPTGTVTFKEGTTTLDTGTLDAAGKATYATTALAAGDHVVTATYEGDTAFASSTSGPLTEKVGSRRAPTSPRKVVVSVGTAQARVSWSAPASNGGGEVVSYAVTLHPWLVART